MKRAAGKRSAPDTIARQWVMLRHVPRYPQKVTTGMLRSRLAAEGHEVTVRTIERDLHALGLIFPLVSDEREKPYGWSWKRDAPALSLPGLLPMEALVFHLAARHLQPLLPAAALKALAPHFRLAEERLSSAAQARSWADKVRVVPATQPLRPPTVRRDVYEAVTEALLTGRALRGTYRRRGDQKAKEYILHLQALVQRGAVCYLVATAFGYADPLLFALHRFAEAECLREPARQLPGFSIDAYIASGALGFGGDEGSIQLEALVNTELAQHLEESPISADQSLTRAHAGRVRLRAIVARTAQLVWWLLGLGDAVEVLRPAYLRRIMAGSARAMMRQYRRRQNRQEASYQS